MIKRQMQILESEIEELRLNMCSDNEKESKEKIAEIVSSIDDLKRQEKARTYIQEFTVTKPQHYMETVGEILSLSQFGEYCPAASLRGYQLEELLVKTENYRPTLIVQKGVEIKL